MPRAPQQARPNVASHHHRQQSPPAHLLMHQQGQSQQGQQGQGQQGQQQAPPDSPAQMEEYYYEMQEQEYIGDYAPEAADECCAPAPSQPQPQTQPQAQAAQQPRDIDAHRRTADVTELYRRRCAAAAELYPHGVYHLPVINSQNPPEYFYDPRVVAPSQSHQVRVVQAPIHNPQPIYRKRVIPVAGSPSYQRPASPSLLPPQAQQSQTHYLTSEEALALRHQHQQAQYEQFLHAQHKKQLHLQRQQQQQIQQQQQQQVLQQPQQQQLQQQPSEVYRVPNVINMKSAKKLAQGNVSASGRVVQMDPRTIGSYNMDAGQMDAMDMCSVSGKAANNGSGASVANSVVCSDTRVLPAARGAAIVGNAPVQMKRHPITVRTPRYIRRAVNSNLYKRPSTLCLPLAVQPDPAHFGAGAIPRRSKRLPHSSDVQLQVQPTCENAQIQMQAQQGQKSQRKIQVQQIPMRNDGSVMPIMIDEVHDEATPIGNAHLPPQTKERLDSIFQRYDRLFRSDAAPSGDGMPMPNQLAKVDPFENIDRFDKFENLEKMGKKEIFEQFDNVTNLKPRTPPSLKEKALEGRSYDASNVHVTGVSKGTQKLPEIMKTAETLQVEEMTTDMLDELLNELTQNGLNDNSGVDQKKRLLDDEEHQQQELMDHMEEQKYQRYLQEKQKAQDQTNTKIIPELLNKEETKNEKESLGKDVPASFTYCDIKNSMSRAKEEAPEVEHSSRHLASSTKPKPEAEGDHEHDHERERERDRDRERKKIRDRKHESEADISSKKSTSSTTSTQRTRSKAKIIPRILVDDAMELHRTKSYVVNLIDTALSNHFGTDKDCKSKKELLKKHTSTTSSKTSQKELAEEIAHVLSESFTSPSRHSGVYKNVSSCSCKSFSQEPMFVRQLRQMRWGHLKHIQQEVRRLEELERFLDSCNMSTFDKCHYH